MSVDTNTIADKSVTTAGTRVQITSIQLYVYSVIIQALGSNTGKIYVGDSNVSSTQCYAELPAYGTTTLDGWNKEKGTMELLDLSKIYIDSSVNGEGVHIGYQIKNA